MRCEAPTTAMLAGFIRGVRSMDCTAARISLSTLLVSNTLGGAGRPTVVGPRSPVARRASWRPLFGLFQAGIQGVAEAVAEEVETQDGHEDGEAGEERDPGVGLDERDVRLEVPAPARRRRLRAEPQ